MLHFLSRRTSAKVTSLISLIALLIFLPLLLLAAYQTATLISRAVGTPADIAIDTKAVLEPITTDFYHAFAQSGGGQSTDMLGPVTSQVRALRPRIIRLDHIFDKYDVVHGSTGNLSFDWTRLDAAVNTILSTGARPMLVLSYMPVPIARDGNIINPPGNWDDWALVVQRTIEHFSGKSEKNISSMYYEVWNEPDLAEFGKWGLGGDKNYLTLYRYAAIGARNASNVNGFFLGGPGTANLYKNWVTALVASGNRLNFLSWHTYQYDPKKFDEDQRNVSSWLLPYPNYTLIPKFITEFGFTGSKNRAYGSTFAAAHAAAVIRQLISGGPAFLFTFQLKDGAPEESNDGWGLITHEGAGNRAKPRYWVYNFLDGMAGDRLALTGEGTWVTGFATIRDNVVRTMLVNFDSSGSHTENVPVAFNNLDPGEYSYRERFLFGRDVTRKETVTGNKLEKQVFMPAQSVSILELTKP